MTRKRGAPQSEQTTERPRRQRSGYNINIYIDGQLGEELRDFFNSKGCMLPTRTTFFEMAAAEMLRKLKTEGPTAFYRVTEGGGHG